MPYQQSLLSAQRYINSLYPNEEHNAGGDCMNPRCDYVFTPQDWKDIEMASGWFTCPKCGYTYNYLDPDYSGWSQPGGRTRSGLTLAQMGSLGENVVESMAEVPSLGKVIQIIPDYKFPIDAIIGAHGVEIKTIHSEAQPRFKIGGPSVGGVSARASKIRYCEAHNLIPAMVGVRLNFYTSKADVFARIGMADTWIGSVNMPLVATVPFANPFPDPSEVPPPSELPDDDDIPFQRRLINDD